MADFAAAILGELDAVFKTLPEDAAERAARHVLSHTRIFVYGAGRSGLMLRAFAMRLMQMGRMVFAVGETITPAIGEGDLLILASASGTTDSVCRCACAAREAGADLFVITAAPGSRLTSVQPADVLLPAGSKSDPGRSMQIMGSLFEQALLIFLDAVVQCIPADREMMRRRHANLE